MVPCYHIYNPALYDTEQQYYLKMGYRLMDSDGNVAAEGDANANLETTDQFIQVSAPTHAGTDMPCVPTAVCSGAAADSCEWTRPGPLSHSSPLLSLGCVHAAHAGVHAVLRRHAAGEWKIRHAMQFLSRI